jgi:mannose-6-phosphate isomerase
MALSGHSNDGADGERSGGGPFRLAPWFSERVWGRRSLEPWYSTEATGTAALVGEAWLTGPGCVIETGAWAGQTLASVAREVAGDEFPLLVKILFPNEKLSVQVHPDDAQAQAMGQARGKTECWYVLEAEPGAAVALGVRDGVTEAAMRAAVADGTLEALMEWVPVAVGDMVYVDAGTVHAIGPGLVLLETQQMCDVTFRLHDYGRGRELHLEDGLRVMKVKTAAGKMLPVAMDGFVRLIAQRYFVVDRYDLAGGEEAVVPAGVAGCLVGLKGAGMVRGVDGVEMGLAAGKAVVVPRGGGEVVVVGGAAGASFARCFAPE